jgi:DNA mismatch repair protein MutS
VIRAARKRLAQLEQQAIDAGAQGDLFATAAASATDAAPEHPALELLRESDPDALSPKQALELLYRLRQQLERR